MSQPPNGNAGGTLQADSGAQVPKYVKLEMQDKFPTEALGPPRGFGQHIFKPVVHPFGMIEQPFFGGFHVQPNTPLPESDQMQYVAKMTADKRPPELGGDFSLTQLALFSDTQPENKEHDPVLDLVTVNYLLSTQEFENVSKEHVLERFPFIGFGISTDWEGMPMGGQKRVLFREFYFLSYDFHGRQNVRNPGWTGRIRSGDFLGFLLKKVDVSPYKYRLNENIRESSEIQTAWQFIPKICKDVYSVLHSNRWNQVFVPAAMSVEDSPTENFSVCYTDLVLYHSSSLVNVYVLNGGEREYYLNSFAFPKFA